MGAVTNWLFHNQQTPAENMRKFILSILLFSQVFSSPAPQDDPNDDAEVFSGPVSTNTDYDTDFIPGGFGGFVPRVRVVVVPISAGSDYEDTESVFPGHRPSFGNVFNLLRSILGNRRPVISSTEDETDVTETENNKPCLICSFFKDSFDHVQDHINTVRDRENEIDFDPKEDGLDINNSTHTTKVLEDGSVVHINKTVIDDTDEDGNSFFFHRAVFHNIGNSEDVEDDIEDNEDEEETAEEVVDLGNEDDNNEDPEFGVDEGLIA